MMSVPLPKKYLDFIGSNGLFEGYTAGMPGYIRLWGLEEIATVNSELEVEQLAPGFLGFGSDGDGEMIAFDSAGAVYMLPFIGMEPQYADRIADSFEQLARRFKFRT